MNLNSNLAKMTFELALQDLENEIIKHFNNKEIPEKYPSLKKLLSQRIPWLIKYFVRDVYILDFDGEFGGLSQSQCYGAGQINALLRVGQAANDWEDYILRTTNEKFAIKQKEKQKMKDDIYNEENPARWVGGI